MGLLEKLDERGNYPSMRNPPKLSEMIAAKILPGLLQSFPMLAKDPREVTYEDLINSGFGVMPLSAGAALLDSSAGTALGKVAPQISEYVAATFEGLPRKTLKGERLITGGPPGVNTIDDFASIVDRYVEKTIRGQSMGARPGYFYDEGSKFIKNITNSPESAIDYANMVGVTSPRQEPWQNYRFTNLGWGENSAKGLIDSPLGLGMDRTRAANAVLSDPHFPKGPKADPYSEGLKGNFNGPPPADVHEFADIFGDPDAAAKAAGNLNSHEFAHRVQDAARHEFNRLTGQNLDPFQIQELHWVGQRGKIGQRDMLPGSARDFTFSHDWEVMTDPTATMHGRDVNDWVDYFNKVKGVVIDPSGRDRVLDAAYGRRGALQLPGSEGVGVYGQTISPGYHSQSLVGTTPNGGPAYKMAGSSEDISKAAEGLRAWMLGQKETGGHITFPLGIDDLRNGALKKSQNEMDTIAVDMGRRAKDLEVSGLLDALTPVLDKSGTYDQFTVVPRDYGADVMSLQKKGADFVEPYAEASGLIKSLHPSAKIDAASTSRVNDRLRWEQGKATEDMLGLIDKGIIAQNIDAPAGRKLMTDIADLYEQNPQWGNNQRLVATLRAGGKNGIAAIREMVKYGLAPAVVMSLMSQYEGDDIYE